MRNSTRISVLVVFFAVVLTVINFGCDKEPISAPETQIEESNSQNLLLEAPESTKLGEFSAEEGDSLPDDDEDDGQKRTKEEDDEPVEQEPDPVTWGELKNLYL